MSLKSKLEAVIYAAEEPVTLTQLAALFAAEALEWKAGQEAAASRPASADASDPTRTEIAEGLGYLDLRSEAGALLERPGFDPEPSAEAIAAEQSAGAGAEDAPAETASEIKSEQESAAAAAAESDAAIEAAKPLEAPLDEEAEAKRVARQRDRDVKAVLRQLIDEIIADCASDDRGVEIREIAGGYRMATKPECHDAVRMFIKSQKPALKLSLPALETLAVIAYKQPVTAPEVNEIRGVDSSGVFGSLMARKLITTAGRKQVIGRPILYKTTKEFLLRFGLRDVSELPSMDEFEKMAAIELEEEPAGATDSETGADYDAGAADGGPELDENAPEEPEAPEAESEATKAASATDARADFVGETETAASGNESNQAAKPAE